MFFKQTFKTFILFISLSIITSLGYSENINQIKGIWLRPTVDINSVRMQLDNIQKAGFNVIYLETFYHGFTLYPSKYVPLRPEMQGTDYLNLYVQEAHKRGIQIQCWIETFYWGVDTSRYPLFPESTLLDQHPDWKTLLRDGRTTNYAEDAHIFANPAHPEVRKLLASFVKELLSKYPVDGINLDYLRYPSGPPDAGYDEYTRKLYRKIAKTDPMEILNDPKNPQWQKWCAFREEQVLKTVKMIKDAKDSTRKTAVLSIAIFPGPIEDRFSSAHYQNWREMLKRGYVDTIIPMCYDETLNGLEAQMNRVKEAIPPKSKTQLMPVIAVQKKNLDVFSGSQHPPIKTQRTVIEKLNLPGFSIFCYDWMMDSQENTNLLQ